MKNQTIKIDSFSYRKGLRLQDCPMCKTKMGDMPGTRDAYCPNCGYKDPCCDSFI